MALNGFLFSIGLSQLSLEDLTGYVSGKNLHDDHVADTLEFGIHTAVAPPNEILNIDTFPLPQDHGCHRCFPPPLTGNTENGDFTD